MKKFTLLLLFIAYGLFLSACTEREAPLFLTIEEQSIILEDRAITRSITIATNADSWTATVQGDAQSWLEAQQVGNAVRITSSANENFDTRTGQIRVVAGELSETVTVTQMGTAPTILIQQSTFVIPANGDDFTLRVTSNIDYEIVLPSGIEWISANKEDVTRAAMITNEYIFSVVFNGVAADRETEIVIRQINGTGADPRTVHVTQRGQGAFTPDTGDIDAVIGDDIRVVVAGGTASSFQVWGDNRYNFSNSFDGDLSTIWHSNWQSNTPNYQWPITIQYFFENEERIDYLIYHPRPGAQTNGNFIETEIWVTTQGSVGYVHVMDFNFRGASSATRVTFNEPLINPTSVKIVINSGVNGFAAAAEIEFFKTNPDNFDLLTLFTDITATELRPEITLECIARIPYNFLRNIAVHLYNDSYPREFRIAEFRAWPNPNDWARENKTMPLSLLDNPTGISVTQGEELIVFVGETHNRPVSLRVINFSTPGSDGWNAGSSTYPLTQGVNRLRMRNRGLVYVLYHTPDWESAPNIKMHFASGAVNGYFDSQKHAPSEWSARLAAAVHDNFDVIGRYAHLTFPTQSFRSHALTTGSALIDTYDEIVRLQKEFMGLMKFNRPPINRVYFHVVHNPGWMWATHHRTMYNINTMNLVANLDRLRSPSPYPTNTLWGPAHEVGHVFQTRPGLMWNGMTEVTVNIKSLWIQQQFGIPSRINQDGTGAFNNTYEAAFYDAFVLRISHHANTDVFRQLVPFWQLQLYFANAFGFEDVYKYAFERVRTTPNLSSGESQLEFVRMMSEITQTNLVNFFYRWGFLTPSGLTQHQITDSQIAAIIASIEAQNFPSPYMIEYIDDSNWQIFRNRLSVQTGTAQRVDDVITMTNWRNVVAYEVFEGDRLIFVSNRNRFTLRAPAPTPANTRVYAVSFDGQRIPVTF